MEKIIIQIVLGDRPILPLSEMGNFSGDEVPSQIVHLGVPDGGLNSEHP